MNIQTRNCPLCSSSSYFKIPVISKLRGDNSGNVKVVCCNNCSQIFLNPLPTKEWYSEFYKSDYRKISTLLDPESEGQLWTEQRGAYALNRIRPFINIDAKILEIGCGNGGILELFKKAGYTNLYGVEPNVNEAKYCSAKLEINVFAGVFEDYDESNFDIVLVNGTIDHIRDPKEFFDSIREKLNTNGILYIDAHDTVAQLADSDIFFKLDHCFYYSPITLDLFLAGSGLKTISFEKFSDYENVVDFSHTVRVSWQRQFKPHFNLIARLDTVQDTRKLIESRRDFIRLDLRIIKKYHNIYKFIYAIKRILTRIRY